ncbi:D-glycero-beta-D-manno-heptose-1,7-bisphosphate 7-phosphatase [Halioglobus japonicus]|nr:D-glycero-beta-D-manno-heptose-1,7-bisphosphate 7-phosphatase [Halioglobus japonicus]
MKIVKQAAILIGGKGTRLGDAVRSTPKPLLDVCGRPFVEHVMLNLRRFGFTEFVLLAGYQSGVVSEKYSENSTFAQEVQATIKVVVEPSPMGTGGALQYARDHLREEFLLLNGDSIFDFNYLDLSNCERDNEPADWLCRVALLPVENATRYGFVELDGSQITAFREKPTVPQSGLINSGVYWIKSSMLDAIEETPCSLEQDIFPKLAGEGRLIGRAYSGFFIDIGIPEDLEAARVNLSEKLRKPAAFLDRDGTLNHDDGYTHKIDDFRWMHGAISAIKALNDAGYLVFIVTNQAGIARGYYNDAAVDTLHEWMADELARAGAHIDDIRYCPHHPQGAVAELAIACDCRKPNTGMLDSLIAQWNPRLSASFMLGDTDKDAEAGIAVGILGKKIEPSSILQEVEQLLEQR